MSYAYRVEYTKPWGSEEFCGEGYDTLADASAAFHRVIKDYASDALTPRPKWRQFWKFKQDVYAYVGRKDAVDICDPSCEKFVCLETVQ